ncbi:hypothetical protein K490DRAFT_56499 [Saccharata proteae CBS 121410]|uniref:Uncharacterized protein n=1 Tax=Saccharata proteae CBS 121410 TaxID=1314787 RepID=A0A9P4M0H7_9PEZI|nr:hypothetical protein K490DRAFT_56499 [Saccharata proteae CBS 121410]
MPAPATRRQAVNKVACTHVVMNKAYACTCQLCGQKPAIGWVYVCAQDETFGKDPWETLANSQLWTAENPRPLRLPSGPELLRIAGCSKSIVESANQGMYSHEQIQMLLKQRNRVNEVIAGSDPKKIKHVDSAAEGDISGATMNPSVDKGSVDLSGESDESVPKEVQRARLRQRKRLCPPCRFKACHTCRPYFKDRLHQSIDAVCAGEVKPLTIGEAQTLPFSSAAILSHIRAMPDTPSSYESMTSIFEPSPTASNMSLDSTLTDNEVYANNQKSAKQFYNVRIHDDAVSTSDEDAVNSTITDSNKKENVAPLTMSQQLRQTRPEPSRFRLTLKQAICDMFQPKRESSSSGSSITLPLPNTGRERELFNNEGEDFDLGLIKKGLSDYGPVKKGAVGATTPVASAPVLARKDSIDSAASEEVEVDGGVALTEEALEKHMPDIMTQA